MPSTCFSLVSACACARLFQEAPVDLPEACSHNLNDLCTRPTDERLLIASAPVMGEVRSKIYSSVIELWETCVNGRWERSAGSFGLIPTGLESIATVVEEETASVELRPVAPAPSAAALLRKTACVARGRDT